MLHLRCICHNLVKRDPCLLTKPLHRLHFSSLKPKTTISDLISSCQISPKTLISASEKILRIQSSKKSPSVLKLFQGFGFSETQIRSIVSRFPVILLNDPDKILKPKFDFLWSVGFSESDVLTIVTRDPFILSRSLKNQLIPSFDFLKQFLGSECDAMSVIKLYPGVLRSNIEKQLLPNVAALQSLGVPKFRICKLIKSRPKAVSAEHSRFKDAVLAVKDMGFNPSSTSCVLAVAAMVSNSKSSWEAKLEVYRSLGLSNDEILTGFKKQPMCMTVREKKIRNVMEFFVKKLHWSPSELMTKPDILLLSLEARIIPRCTVLQVLMSGKLIEKNVNVLAVLKKNEADFLQKFVAPYHDRVPQVMEAWRGKLKYDAFDRL